MNRPSDVCVIAVGDELTQGKTVETNGAWLSQRLADIGLRTAMLVVLPDRVDILATEIRRLWASGRSLILTGGIGPTEDDRTRQALALALDSPLVLVEAQRDRLRSRYAALGRDEPPGCDRQAMIPQSCVPLSNDFGTATGCALFGDTRFLAVLPGVPREMRGMYEATLAAELAQRYGAGNAAYTRELACFGAYEASINAKLSDLLQGEDSIDASILASDSIIAVSWRTLVPAMRPRVDELAHLAATRLGDLVFENIVRANNAGQPAAPDTPTPPDRLAAHVVDELRKAEKRLAVAESCTGGMIAALLTGVPGASDVFDCGVVSYSDAMKSRLLGVQAETIANDGAVSAAVVQEMAQGVLALADADIAVAASGIAGPGGGTHDKPVGLVWFGLATREAAASYPCRLSGDRALIQQRAARTALDLVRKTLMGGVPSTNTIPNIAP